MAKHYDNIEKSQILFLFEEGLTYREISKKLSIPVSTIHRTIERYKKTNSFERKPNSGRPKILNNKEVNIILNIIKETPKISSKKLANELDKSEGKTVTSKTIRNYLNQNGFYGRIAAKKPLLSLKNKKLRNEIVTNWLMYPKSFWKKIIFSYETKINLFGSDGIKRVWRKQNSRYDSKNISHTVKHGGGSVLVWGCISYNGVGNLHFIDGIMDSIKYCSILNDSLLFSVDNWEMDEWIFQQDNDPKHKSKLTKEFFTRNNISVLPWPAQSPDLNIIKHVWAYIKRELLNFEIKNILELKEKILLVWNSIPLEFIRKLYDSLPKRMEQVLRAKGGHSDY